MNRSLLVVQKEGGYEDSDYFTHCVRILNVCMAQISSLNLRWKTHKE